MAIGKRLKWALDQKRVSQRALAQEIGVSAQTINKIISVDQSKTIFSTQIADALNLDVKWLITGEGHPWLADSDLATQVHAMVKKLPEEKLRFAKNMLENLVEL